MDMEKIIKAIETCKENEDALERAVSQSRIVVGIEIRNCRNIKKTSLRDMAKMMGISPAYLSDIELGKRGVSRMVYDKLIEHLSVHKE
jgi:predicted transcriptional regulator